MASDLKNINSKILKNHVLANLEYWLQCEVIPITDQSNLQRLVLFGIQADECRAETIKFVQNIFPLIEEWGHIHQWIAILTRNGKAMWDSSFAQQALLIGKLFEIKKDFSRALKWYMESEKRIQLIDDPKFRINLFSGLCFVYWGLDEINKVNEYRCKLYELINDWSELDVDPGIQMLMGQLALISENYFEAKSRYSSSLKVLKDSSDHQKIASSTVNLALAIYLSGQLDETWRCLGYLAQAAQIYHDIGNLQELYRLELLKGLIYFRMGEKDRAVEVLSNINISLDSFNGNTGLMLSKLSEGLMQAFSGDYKAATIDLYHSRRLAEEAGDYSIRDLVEQSIKDFGN